MNRKSEEKSVKMRLVWDGMYRLDRCELQDKRTAYWGT